MNINSVLNSQTVKSTMKLTTDMNQGEDFEAMLQSAVADQDDKKLRDACKQVETYMITSLFKQMKKSTEMGERLIPKGDYEEMFEDYLVEEQCKNIALSGGIGLADMMYKQMTASTAVPNKVDLGV